jgi:hypothetical protein
LLNFKNIWSEASVSVFLTDAILTTVISTRLVPGLPSWAQTDKLLVGSVPNKLGALNGSTQH